MYWWTSIWRKGPKVLPACVQAYGSFFSSCCLTLLGDFVDIYN